MDGGRRWRSKGGADEGGVRGGLTVEVGGGPEVGGESDGLKVFEGGFLGEVDGGVTRGGGGFAGFPQGAGEVAGAVAGSGCGGFGGGEFERRVVGWVRGWSVGFEAAQQCAGEVAGMVGGPGRGIVSGEGRGCGTGVRGRFSGVAEALSQLPWGGAGLMRGACWRGVEVRARWRSVRRAGSSPAAGSSKPAGGMTRV